MDPITIAIICAAVFGVVATLAAFIRQLLLSRDKELNDKAQERALAKETANLEKMRNEMANNKRFDTHYQVLGSNKEAIMYIDQKIEDNLKRKYEIIQRYAKLTIKESSNIISGETSEDRKKICDKLKEEMDKEIKFYDSEIFLLQTRRGNLWDSHSEFQDYLLDQEKKRNKHLDGIYKQHSDMLEKVYLRHNENSEHVATSSIKASTETFKALLMAPIHFLMSVFKLSTGISTDAAEDEVNSRDEVDDIQSDINGEDDVWSGNGLERNDGFASSYGRARNKIEI